MFYVIHNVVGDILRHGICSNASASAKAGPGEFFLEVSDMKRKRDKEDKVAGHGINRKIEKK